MLASYPFDVTPLNQNPALGGMATQKNAVLSFTFGDMKFTVEPGQPGATEQKEMPAKVLRCPAAVGSGLVPTNTGLGPHQDYVFLTDSCEYTYTTRAVVGGGVVEKQMPAGARVGQEGRMILYKNCTLAQVEVGGWTERLIRPFLITAADLAARETGWPASGSAPTVDVTNRKIVDNSGDGYNHI